MAANPFRGLTVAELLVIRASALADINAGTVTISGGVSGKSFGKQVVSSAQERLRFANKELARLDPVTYGYRVTTTLAQIV